MAAGRKKELLWNKDISARIKGMVKSKVKIDYILATIQEEYDHAPTNVQSMYKVYGNDIKAARAEAIESVGKKVLAQAEDGHFPSQEMYLTTQEDWSKKDKLEVDLANDEDNSALSTLLTMLGVDKERKND